MNTTPWRCPLCQQPLHAVARQFTCSNRHSFDQAKEGYVNLLPVNRKHSADPGDNKAMLDSRRYFLQQGFYAPLASALAHTIRTYFPDTRQPLTLLDAGCGEGYYLNQLAQVLGENVQYCGTDISRSAMRLAAKQYPAMPFAVASSFELPLADASVDVLVRVFAPASEAEIVRVLKPGGLYVWAYPAAQHLFELRTLIYDDPKPHSVEDLPPMVGMLEREPVRVNDAVTLPNQASVAALLHMTPYYWSASAAKQAHCQQLDALTVTLDFEVRVMCKQAEEA
ncbi:putative RNA methyltransferase [Thiothrix fructosivorans]|uniref:Methyltransferase domain-containing protein n=1 Tax=Thiothrix fructosivorans TaxID=111770 RepID=A0A8B0SNP8_9GAMM|nr:methyltransferase domain-containing protein [Thiothrix fructosivorans]MBO0614189.1 methyltransferase domain-containing protein [Thiothrix fructosivorans]QTX12671.1 methyltransferase domain-containing protein [Thiothrix fructosivorans]